MTAAEQLVAQYRADLARDDRQDTAENRRAWLWFSCPADRRAEVQAAMGSLESSRTVGIRIRVSDAEREQLHASAARAGLTLSQFVRSRCGL